MKNFENKSVSKPIKVAVTRLEEVFEETNPFPIPQQNVIKDYVYCNQKRIIA